MPVATVTEHDLDNRVLRAPGPVVLDFYQATCPPCRVLEPRLAHVAEQYRDRVSVYRVDIDRDMSIADRFRVKSIPTILVVVDGHEAERLDGLINDSELQMAFERAAAHA